MLCGKPSKKEGRDQLYPPTPTPQSAEIREGMKREFVGRISMLYLRRNVFCQKCNHSFNHQALRTYST